MPFCQKKKREEGRAGQNAQFAGTGQRADSVHLVEKLCSFYPLDHHRHTRERAGMRDRGGSAVGARYIVRGGTTRHNCTVLKKELKASALGVPRKRVLGIKVLLRAGACRPREKLARSITSPPQPRP